MASSSATSSASYESAPGHLQPPWTKDVVWQSHVTALRDFPNGFSILELCAGAGTASIAMDILLGKGKSTLVGAWDISEELKVIYDCVHASFVQVHLGDRDGDILATDLSAFPCANAVIGGPPCPPFSSVGKRRALADERSRPFERCIDIIVELDSRAKGGSSSAPLMFFILENVLGIRHRSATEEASPLDILMGQLQRRLGEGWAFRPVVANALDYGLPQSRSRVYLVGRKLQWYPIRQPVQPPFFERRVTAGEILDKSDTEGREYTALQASCLVAWKKKFRHFMTNKHLRGRFGFVEVNRDPTQRTSWKGNSPFVDRCECLRATGPVIHVFALGEGVGQLSLDRPLRVRERAGLQGFPASVGHLQLDETTGRRIFGNAMAVPVIGSMLAQELLSFMDSLPRAALAAACSGDVGSLQPKVPRTLVSVANSPARGSQGHLIDGPGRAQVVRRDSSPKYQRTNDSSAEATEANVLPGLRAACVAWAASIQAHWNTGQPGRAPRPRVKLGPVDEFALTERSKKRVRLGIHSSDISQDNLGARCMQRQSQASVAQHNSSDIPQDNLREQDSEDVDVPMSGFAGTRDNLKDTQELLASARSPLLEVARKPSAVSDFVDDSSDEPISSFA